MEAIPAFALACNVIQVVDFGLKTASKYREIYKEGSAIEHQDLEYTTKHLAEITGNLSTSIQNARTNKPLTKDDNELQNLAQQCTESADNLRNELDKLKTPGRQGKRAALLKTWKSVRKSDDIKKIRDKICEYERVLDTRLLSRLSERFDLLAVRQDESFKTLDQTIQNFVNNLASGYNKLSDLISRENATTRGTITQEHRDTRDHITSNFQHMQLGLNNEQHRAKFLASLYYPEMQERQEIISEAHQRTFEWIFDRTGKGIRPWNDFVDWLEKRDGIYWIQGKAGAGKSTLMNYITTDSRTTDSLNAWSHPSQVLTLTFFFWNAGTELQKSSLGLLRSFLYQILDHQHGIISELVKSQGIATLDDPMVTWTRRRLESSLNFVIDRISVPLCLFIDGLDEFDEGEDDLLQLISALQSRPSIKICLSSRPSQCFINAFEHSAQLKLQDLTRRDIEIFVVDRLHKDPRMAVLLQEDSWRGKRLVRNVIAKAEGVFLWVDLAVKILLKGLTNKDDWDMMEKRLYLLPKGIESLYTHMWNRLGEDQKLYRETAALYFRIILLKEMSLLQFLIVTNENLQSSLLDLTSPPPRTEDVVSMCENAKIRVLTRCAGFLEVNDVNHDTSNGDESDWNTTEDTESGEDELNKTELGEEDFDECQTDGGPIEDETQEDELAEDELDKNELDEGRFSKGGTPYEAKDDPRLKQLHERTRVRFIHRTAHDFLLETTTGQAILGENPPPASSLSTWLCKSELGLDRLLPLTASLDLGSVLDNVRDAQNAENAALEPLMDTIESYLSTKYSGVSPNSNWLENYRNFAFEGLNPYRPATDFLGLAAFHGVCLDMSDRFLRHIQRADPSLTNCLLSCAVNYHYDMRMELVLMLLLNGADPSTSIAVYSEKPWQKFLRYCELLRERYNKHPSTTKVLFETIEAFLNNGADLHEKIHIMSHRDLSHTSGGNFKSGGTSLKHELSARYVVTEALHQFPRFPEIEERFESAGAQASARLLSATHHQNGLPWGQGEPVSEDDFQYLLETPAISAYRGPGTSGYISDVRALEE